MAIPNIKKNKQLFLKFFKENRANISKTCEHINISRKQYYQWMKKDKTFANNVIEAQESLIDDAESALVSLIDEKNPPSIFFFLKTKGKSRGYVEHQTHDVYHKELPPIELKLPSIKDIKDFHDGKI